MSKSFARSKGNNEIEDYLPTVEAFIGASLWTIPAVMAHFRAFVAFGVVVASVGTLPAEVSDL